MFAFVFESVGSGEWLVLLAVILIVVGPRNLPSAARKMGQVMSKLRRAADEFKRQLMTMDEEMKKTADEIKRDYIDIPEDGSDHAADSAAGSDLSADDPGYDYPDDPDHMGDYPEGYPEEDYYGATSGMDADPASMDSPADAARADGAAESAPEPAGEPQPAMAAASAPADSNPKEMPETTHGQDS